MNKKNIKVKSNLIHENVNLNCGSTHKIFNVQTVFIILSFCKAFLVVSFTRGFGFDKMFGFLGGGGLGIRDLPLFLNLNYEYNYISSILMLFLRIFLSTIHIYLRAGSFKLKRDHNRRKASNLTSNVCRDLISKSF